MIGTCEHCGVPFERVSQPFDYATLAGLDPREHTVLLHSIEVDRCACGVAPRIPNVEGLHLALVMALCSHPRRLDPSGLRFLRKTLGLTQRAFGDLVDVKNVTISKWENGATRPEPQYEITARTRVLSELIEDPDLREMFNIERARALLKALSQLKPTEAGRGEPVELTSVPPSWRLGPPQDDPDGVPAH